MLTQFLSLFLLNTLEYLFKECSIFVVGEFYFNESSPWDSVSNLIKKLYNSRKINTS